MKILGYAISEDIVINSDNEYQQGKSILRFMLQRKPDTIRVVSNITYSIMGISEIIGLGKRVHELIETTFLKYPPYNFRFIPEKFFSVKKSNYIFNHCYGYFSYYNDLSKYSSISENGHTPLKLAELAQQNGQEIYDTLMSLGINPINLLNPDRQYIKQVIEVNSISKESCLFKLQSEAELRKGLSKAVMQDIIKGVELYYKNIYEKPIDKV
jgi:hypothetical protein